SCPRIAAAGIGACRLSEVSRSSRQVTGPLVLEPAHVPRVSDRRDRSTFSLNVASASNDVSSRGTPHCGRAEKETERQETVRKPRTLPPEEIPSRPQHAHSSVTGTPAGLRGNGRFLAACRW